MLQGFEEIPKNLLKISFIFLYLAYMRYNVLYCIEPFTVGHSVMTERRCRLDGGKLTTLFPEIPIKLLKIRLLFISGLHATLRYWESYIILQGLYSTECFQMRSVMTSRQLF